MVQQVCAFQLPYLETLLAVVLERRVWQGVPDPNSLAWDPWH